MQPETTARVGKAISMKAARCAIWLALLALEGCGATRQPVVQTPLTPVMEEDIRTGVRRRLRDPMSAQFENIRTGRNTGGAIEACGEVNSRNAFGGYVGRAPFWGHFKDGRFEATIIGNGLDGFNTAVVRSICAQAGLRLPD